MAVVGYARVSANDQDLSIQIKTLKDAGVTKLFMEKESGTSTKERGELEKCLTYVRDGDILMVTRMDRMARSLADFMKIITDLNERDVKFKCLLQPEIDTSNDSATGRLITSVVAAMAQFETEIRKERQREGIAAAKARGVYTKKASYNGRLGAASKMLNNGAPYKYVAEKTAIPENTLRRRFPGHLIRHPRPKGSKTMAPPEYEHIARMIDGHIAASNPSTPSAGKPVEAEPTPETPATKQGLFGKILGR